MLSCKDATERMSQSLDRPLSVAETISLRFHLLICRGCRATEGHFQFLHTATRRWRNTHTQSSAADAARTHDS